METGAWLPFRLKSRGDFFKGLIHALFQDHYHIHPCCFKEDVMAMCSFIKNSYGVLLGVATGGVRLKCVFRYWELTLKNDDGLGAGRGPT
ncbi:hypothetical protein STEG23_023022 [Scotinomys teguina]